MVRRKSPSLRQQLLKSEVGKAKVEAGLVPTEVITPFENEETILGEGTPPTQQAPQVLSPGKNRFSSLSNVPEDVKLTAHISAADALQQLRKRFNDNAQPNSLACCAAIVEYVERAKLLGGFSGRIIAMGCTLLVVFGLRTPLFTKTKMGDLGIMWTSVRQAYNQLWLHRDALEMVISQHGGDIEQLYKPERLDGHIDRQVILKDLRSRDKIVPNTTPTVSSNEREVSRLREVMFPEPDAVDGDDEPVDTLESDESNESDASDASDASVVATLSRVLIGDGSVE